ncbi:carbon-nitrogen family hydrolase [Oceanobacillus kimchii]|uniref:carbon-nitrogen family hydrolase n=1 Tax=Oceanobacillus TaxID=182709 RepID=UPI00034D9159|nr:MULTISPECIES: carbon-nitrogen family hydrolase [Oceanobacillus]MCT1576761.1 carbon-nitrogen family hydrolase [Oceanobacillus kimchii]MCT2134831.1 carbon-nitrogen family hydrolase [Oceanobacillus kimchii]OEH56125.1 nitrilase [Oceanobacillus sp. E9]
MRYAIYQMDIVPGNPEANRLKVKTWIEKTVSMNDIDIIVLPEMWTTGYTLAELNEVADEEEEPTCSFLQQLARDNQVHIIGGSIANKRNGKINNTAIVVNSNGEKVYKYDKIHLVPMLDEPTYLDGGEEKVCTFELDGVKMGLIICYDLRFPELTRSLAVSGAEVIYIVAEWPSARKDHWKALQLARAIENQCYIISANRVGIYNNVEFCGLSSVINPWGEIQTLGSDHHEETIIDSIDLQKVSEARKNVPIFESRVPKLY